MNYLIVEDGIITNIIVASKEVAEEMGLLPWYDGSEIGGAYTPPPPIEERVKRLEETSQTKAEAENFQNTTEAIQSDTDAMLVDYEYRLTMLELGLA